MKTKIANLVVGADGASGMIVDLQTGWLGHLIGHGASVSLIAAENSKFVCSNYHSSASRHRDSEFRQLFRSRQEATGECRSKKMKRRPSRVYLK